MAAKSLALIGVWPSNQGTHLSWLEEVAHRFGARSGFEAFRKCKAEVFGAFRR
jgi:hypothetical protein